MFSEDCRARLSGSEKINWKSIASEGTPVKTTRTGHDDRKPPAEKDPFQTKCEETYFPSKRSNEQKEKKSRSENPDWATKPHNRTGRCMPEHAASGDARQASQVQGWQTRSLGAAILILGDGRGGQRETCPRECSCSLKIPQCDGCKTCLRKCIRMTERAVILDAGNDALSPARYTSLLERWRWTTPEKAQRTILVARTTAESPA